MKFGFKAKHRGTWQVAAVCEALGVVLQCFSMPGCSGRQAKAVALMRR